MRLFFILFFLSLSTQITGKASALEFSVEETKLGPFGDSVWVRLEGKISNGDSARLAKILESIKSVPLKAINFEFDSHGGSVAEAIKIGRLISNLPHGVTTTIGSNDASLTGECASACVLAFMGGHYRFTGSGRLGVHQFFFGGEGFMSGEEATSISQLVSADIVSYLQEMRVNPEFLQIMASTSSNSIYWVPNDILAQYRVVNRNIYDERDEYKNADGFYYLLMWQQSRYGENKIVIGCDSNKNLVMIAYLQPPEMYMNGRFQIRIDGVSYDPETWEVVKEDRWVEVLFSPTLDQIQRMQKAKTFGARMLPPSEYFFFGFEKQVQDNKFSDTLSGCAGRDISSSTNNSVMSDIVDVDFPGNDLLRMGVKGVSYESCKNICLLMPDCRAVTWVRSSQWCWPKHTVTQPIRQDGLMSAIRQ